MRFGPVSLDDSVGRILAHNVSDETGRRVLRKGRPLDGPALELLRTLGYESVFVASLEEGDIHEDEAAERIARVVAGAGLKATAGHAGRVNVSARGLGIVLVDAEALRQLNEVEGVTVATLPTNALVYPGDRAATVKVIPYFVPADALVRAEADVPTGGIVSVRPIGKQSVAIALVGSPGAWSSLENGIGASIRSRIEALGCVIEEVAHLPADEESLSEGFRRLSSEGATMIVIAGETAIMDLDDLIPRGLRSAGGVIEQLGLPMDPGQLLLLGYLGQTPVVGAPGCVRGSAPDGFDAVVPRLLSGERLTGADLREMGHGGLLSDPRRR